MTHYVIAFIAKDGRPPEPAFLPRSWVDYWQKPYVPMSAQEAEIYFGVDPYEIEAQERRRFRVVQVIDVPPEAAIQFINGCNTQWRS